MAGGLQILRVQANTRTNGGRSRARSKNHLDLRLGINGSGVPGGIDEVNAHLRVGVGGREKDVLLESALGRNRGRDAAEGNVARLDKGDGSLRDAGVVDLGESEDGDDACGVNRSCSGRWRRRRHGRGSLVEAGGIDGAASVAPGAAVRTVDLCGYFERHSPSELGGINDRVVQILGEK